MIHWKIMESRPRRRSSALRVQVLERRRSVVDGKNPEAAAVELVSKLRNEARVIS